MSARSRVIIGRIVVPALLASGGIAVFLLWRAGAVPGQEEVQSPLSSESAVQMEVYRRLCDAKTLAEEGQHQKALALFDEIVNEHGDSSYAWDADVQAARAMGILGDHERALARLNRIVAECPNEDEKVDARITKADVLSLSGDEEGAVDELEQIIADYTDVQPRYCEDALSTMSAVYRRSGRDALSHGALLRIIADYPGSEDTTRRWAIRRTDELREKVSTLQQERIDSLKKGGDIRVVDEMVREDTTWTPDGGPYIVLQAVEIEPDAMLRIQAGTVIRFGVTGALRVAGRLIATGTADRPIEFLPLGEDATREWWAGIHVEADGDAASAQLSHCRLVGGEVGVELIQGAAELDHCLFSRCGRVTLFAGPDTRLAVKNCDLRQGHRVGVECESASVLEMADSVIAEMTTYGLILQEVGPESSVRGTRVEGCGWDGMLVRGRCAPAVDDCRILKCRGNGLRAVEEASPSVLKSIISENAGAGIRLEQRWDGAIRHNTISANRGGGIVAEVRCGGEIAANRLVRNQGFGLCLRLDCRPMLVGNQIMENLGAGVILEESRPEVMRHNAFEGNTDGAVRNEGPSMVEAAENWWGSTDKRTIAEAIHDGNDEPAWGRVEFTPWLPQPPPEAD